MASIGISDVVTASVYSEKTRMKKLMMMKMIIIIITRTEIDFRLQIQGNATSLHHCLQNHHQYCIALNINRPVVNLAEAGL